MSAIPLVSRTILALAVTSALAAACGDLHSDPQPGAIDSATASAPPTFIVDSGVQGIAEDLVSSCPTNAPVDSQECTQTQTGATCEFGSSPDMACNTTFSCGADQQVGSAWTARPSVLCPSYQCPKGDAAAVDGQPCDLPTIDGGAPGDADELICAMNDAVCACTTGIDDAHKHARTWVCVKPAADCPTERPLVGTHCSTSTSCDYGGCAFKRGMRMECKNAIWVTGGGQCN